MFHIFPANLIKICQTWCATICAVHVLYECRANEFNLGHAKWKCPLIYSSVICIHFVRIRVIHMLAYKYITFRVSAYIINYRIIYAATIKYYVLMICIISVWPLFLCGCFVSVWVCVVFAPSFTTLKYISTGHAHESKPQNKSNHYRKNQFIKIIFIYIFENKLILVYNVSYRYSIYSYNVLIRRAQKKPLPQKKNVRSAGNNNQNI